MVKNAVFLILALLLVIGLFVVFRPKPSVTQSTTTIVSPPITKVPMKDVSFVIQGNELISGDKIISLTEGDTLHLMVTADHEDELHIHGYDKEVALKKDVPTEIEMAANLTGRFPIELHGADVEVAVLEVQPK